MIFFGRLFIYSMVRIAVNIHILSHEKAMDFFMKSERCHGFELLEHFTFNEVLKFVCEEVGTITDETPTICPPLS